jgi:hypothetical protein
MAGIGRFAKRSHRWHDELEELEMELLDPESRKDASRMGQLLSDDFIEFGSSGRVYEKGMLVAMIAKEEHAKVLIRDFSVRELSANVALVTYRTVGQAGQEARRSSVWVTENGKWQMVFHQGTRIPNSWGPVG